MPSKRKKFHLRIDPYPTTKLEKRSAVLIAKTLSKLPPKIARKVEDKATFVLKVEDRYDLSPSIIGYPSSSEPTIFLDFVSSKESNSCKMANLAHEIAHFVLKHFSDKRKNAEEARQREAEDLCKKWGFERASDRLERGNRIRE